MVLAALSVAVTAIAAAPLPSAPAALRDRTARTMAASAASPAEVTVDPGTWWLETGTNVTLRASWIDVPPGCAVTPSWFRWSIAPGGTEGSLASTVGPTTVFVADGGGTGVTTAAVDSAAVLRCAGNASALASNATAALTVEGPVSLADVAIEPNPAVPGTTVELRGTVGGGSPPYRLQVAWGDGATSSANVSAAGEFSLGHVYPANGTYRPTIVATDVSGGSAEAGPPEPVNVSAGFAAAIAPSAPVAEVGVPVDFQVSTVGAPAAFSSLFGCDDAVLSDPDGGPSLEYGCTFRSPGPSPVTFEAVGAETPYRAADAVLEQPVVAPPSVTLGPSEPNGEVGETLYAPLAIAGGVPPFQLAWSVVGSGARGTATLASDGTAFMPLNASDAGTFVLTVDAVDALSVASLPATEDVDFAPPLGLEATGAAAPAGTAVSLNVSASVVGGAAPFDWAIVASTGSPNASAATGVLAVPGTFGWNATVLREGPLGVVVQVVDAQGRLALQRLTELGAPAPRASLTLASPGPGRLVLRVTVAGGVAPYAVRWNDSRGGDGSLGAKLPGTLVRNLTGVPAGPLVVTVVVLDALGYASLATGNVSVAASPAGLAAADGVEPFAVVLVTFALVAIVGWAVVRRGRRSRARPPAPLDPVAVLREVIEPSDGVDRALVEMLAEERGLAPEVVRATLERLKADGTVRSGRGFDGEEALAWSEPERP